MRWPWQKRHDHSHGADAAAARADAEQALDDAQRRGEVVREVAGRLEEIRRRNRFAEMIEQALRDHR